MAVMSGNTFETGNAVQIKGSLGQDAKAEQYLNMIKMSDQALEKLVRYFEKEEEPTVISLFWRSISRIWMRAFMRSFWANPWESWKVKNCKNFTKCHL